MKRLQMLLLSLALLLPPALLTGAETPRRGGKLVFGIRNDISGMNPFTRTSSTNFYVRGLIYETLLDFDKEGKLVPALAESWTISPDGKVYTFKLRKGVAFHNGKETTAEDVKWSVEYAMDGENSATGFHVFQALESVNAKDKLTVEFVLKTPDAAFLTVVATIRSFPVIPARSVEPRTRDLPAFPPGTGPFAFKQYEADRQLVLVRNSNYWQKGLPYLDELVLKPVREDQVRFTAVRAGDVDMIERTPYSYLAKILKGEVRGLNTTVAKYAGYRRLLFNVANPPFDNVKLRQAVRYALDKKKYLEGAFWGFGEPTDQLYPKGQIWYVPLPEVKRDPAKVKQLLKEAGVGPNFEVEIMGLRSEDEELQVLQQQLATAGIKTKVTILERGARLKRETGGDFMMVLSGGDIPPDPAQEWASEFGCREEDVKAKRRTENSAGYCNKEMDRLLEEAVRIQDEKKRYEVYAKVARMLHDDIPDIPLVYVPRYFTYQQKVRGFETDLDGRFQMTTAGFSHVWIEGK